MRKNKTLTPFSAFCAERGIVGNRRKSADRNITMHTIGNTIALYIANNLINTDRALCTSGTAGQIEVVLSTAHARWKADPGCCTAQNFDQYSEKWRRSEGRDSPDPLAVQKSVGGGRRKWAGEGSFRHTMSSQRQICDPLMYYRGASFMYKYIITYWILLL